MKFFYRLIIFSGLFLTLSFGVQIPDGRVRQFNSGAAYSKEEICAIKKLTVLYIGNDNQFDGDEYRVIRYHLIMAPKNGQAEYFEVEADSMSEMVKAKIISNLISGDKLLFDDIDYITNQGVKKQCSPLVIYIK